MLRIPWHSQPCATCDTPVKVVRVSVEAHRETKAITFNVNTPCGCVHNVEETAVTLDRASESKALVTA